MVKIFVNMPVPKALRHDGKTGSLVRAVEIFKEFKRQNSEITLVFNVTEWMARYFQDSGVEAEYRILPTNLKFSGYVGLCLKAGYLIGKSVFIFGVPRAKKEDERILVYASSDLFWEVIPAFIFKILNNKIEWVQIIHHLYPDWRKRSGSKIVSFSGYYLQRFSLFLIRKKADKIILMNSLIQKELVSKGFQTEKMRVLSNGINFEHMESLNKGGACYKGVFLGRLNASKGVLDLIQIWKRVCAIIPEAKLAIIGGAEKTDKARLIAEIKLQGLEQNIEVLGFLQDEEAFAIMKASKVFVSPSHEEGWGIAIAEALACAVPVVSWDLSVYQEVFEDNILQTRENDLDSFAKNVIGLLQDESKGEYIGERGREFVKKYSWREVAKKELEVILS